MASESTLAKVFVYGFALIFVAIGIAVLYAGLVAFQDAESITKPLVMLFAGLAFAGAGVAVFALVRFGMKGQVKEDALRAAHPGEPWMWRDDWAAGYARSTERGGAWFLWGFAILWNLISMPLLFFLPEEVIEKQNYGALIGLLFPLVGVGLIIAAVRKSIQHRKYGDCRFVMDRVPGVLGGVVAGTLLLPRGASAAETVTVSLSCIHRRRVRSGKSTSTNETTVWQTEPLTVPLLPAPQEGGRSAQIRFTVPYDTSPTEQIDENSSILWRLETGAALPGVDYAATFEVPVFKTAASSAEATEEHLRSREAAQQPAAVETGSSGTIAVVPSAAGGKEFILRPGPGRSSVKPALVVVVLFGGIGALLAVAGAPFLFPLIFGGIGAAVLFLIFFTLYGESRIVVEDGYVSVRNYMLGLMMGKHARCAQITKISVRGSAQPGKGGFYSVVLTRSDGKTLSPLQSLYDRRQADWLAEEVRKAMEPWRTGKKPDEAAVSEERLGR